ncbi:MAG: D-alanine--D-alanine ligase [Methylacidiphilales bacterium]|nr:D-alanine--D-alanine ligase [Candidatus Methylacidiphilales bacterium]MDW8349793.1 D-alanine--D-alanine ligase [Verrucomicrobiae bacterium]
MKLAHHIAVLKGGISSEREVSLRTGAAVASALRRLGYEVEEIDVQNRTPVWSAGVDLVFICLHGEFGEDGEVQTYCETKGVPYTGCGVAASQAAYDKGRSKAIFFSKGVPCAESETLIGEAEPKMQPPFVLKPVCQGSSVGIEFVQDAAEVSAALARVRQYHQPVLVERWIRGREVTVGILEGETLPIVEIRPKRGWYNYENKYTAGATEYICPAELAPELAGKVRVAAKQAYEALGCEVYARIDLMIDEQDNVYVLEVNTIPGMTETSLLPKAARVAGLSFEALCERIIAASLRIRGSVEDGRRRR